jgi:hypothetical protein
MSSGKIEQNYFENIENGVIYRESVIVSEKYLHKSHSSESKSHKEDFDIRLQNPNKGIVDDNLDMIQKIHLILKNTQDLTQEQKYDYCNSQRFFMKLYLKRIGERI